ncbi:phytanoyl-CoA dioxygenase family protein [Lewinella sp. W8]|uniref:phytanoyl-CoA dioxygenase family protein n=1 Tax=Lewinella sp. W8 TaxID=2528208 RepID=UPI001067A01F|nr:phytanoyl-CoA dioxygenase family protein [Lewinella sp. W8]MTB52686.1 phytanoyl-CoA dioxygenase [Lewinella sp. W8]
MISPLGPKGFEVIEDVYSKQEIDEILRLIHSKGLENRYGVRNFLADHPEIAQKVFTDNLLEIIKRIAPDCTKSIKSIYFDKPPSANWIVNWHQDLTINLTNRKEVPGFRNWRVAGQRTVVQPPRAFLENIFTVRIHLDDCPEENGALRVMEGSHTGGVIQIKDWMKTREGVERICEVQRGGILVMKPLILHASRRTENHKSRRVIHVEFTDQELPDGLQWKEGVEI